MDGFDVIFSIFLLFAVLFMLRANQRIKRIEKTATFLKKIGESSPK